MFFSYKSLLFTYWTEIRVSERFRSSLLLSFSRYEHAPQCPIIFNGCDTTLNFPTDTVPTSQVFLKKKIIRMQNPWQKRYFARSNHLYSFRIWLSLFFPYCKRLN
jgi:hypothetical protein